MSETDTRDPRVERTRSKVVAAALELLKAGGPEAVTHQRVAEAAGVGRATVYRHWPDRWSLIFQAVESLSLTVPPVTDGPIRERLIALLQALCDRLESPVSVQMSSLISRAEWEPEVRAFLDRLLARASAEISLIIEQGVQEEGLALDVRFPTAVAIILGPFFYERFIAGRVTSRDQIPFMVDGLLARWLT